MSKKTLAVAYFSYKIRTTNKTELAKFILQAPIKKRDVDFLCDIIDGLTYSELAEKHQKSLARIYQWKRNLFEKLHKFDCQQETSLAKANKYL